MCGIAGFVAPEMSAGSAREVARRMADALRHRGPDGGGEWFDMEAGVALAHRRLSIIDLSDAGQQPMHSAGGRYVLSYNGEIYNHRELREGIQSGAPDQAWNGHSDTETLLALIENAGLELALESLTGMFAFALWDRKNRTLDLVRDRFGEKPLYFGWVGRSFVFSSELKSFRTFPDFSNPVCQNALSAYFRNLYVPAPLSIYAGVYKLEAGCRLTISIPNRDVPQAPEVVPAAPFRAAGISIRRWWDATNTMAASLADPIRDHDTACGAVEASLVEAIRSQSIADVPLGAFLSGGVDSSLIVALMQANSGTRVETFSIGFEDPSYDESVYARAVANHLGTDHHEMIASSSDVLNMIPSLARIYDEPFADSSQVPTAMICRAARERVSVALTGDAGDELFGGYNRHVWGPKLWPRIAAMPDFVRHSVANVALSVPATLWDAGARLAGRSRLPNSTGRYGEKIHKLAARIGASGTIDDFYGAISTEWNKGPEFTAPASDPVLDPLRRLIARVPQGLTDPASRMMFLDTVGYMTDDVLCKVDRAAMSASLETRVPFLDHRVFATAWQVPLDSKISGGKGKRILRDILSRYVPAPLIDRPKTGFSMPIGQWLRSDLRDWAEALLDTRSLAESGHLDPAPIRNYWEQHVSGKRDWTARIWSVVMFQSWYLETRQC